MSLRPGICGDCGNDSLLSIPDYAPPIIPKHLVETNDTPKVAEEMAVRQQLPAIRDQIVKHIEETDLDLERLETALEAARMRRKVMQQALVAIQGVTSPIRRVPREVISEIILSALCTGSSPELERTSLDTTQGVWVYSRVCRMWRDEILSHPSIWAKISVDSETLPSFWSPAIACTILDEIFSRSKDHNLDIHVRFQTFSVPAQNVLDRILQSSPRWSAASFTLFYRYFSRFSVVKNRVPRLEILHINPYQAKSYRYNPIQTFQINGCFANAPSLRQVELGHFSSISRLELPWSQLTSLTFENLGDSDGQVLGQFTNLRQLGIMQSHSLYGRWGPVGKVVLPHLCSLILSPSLMNLLPHLHLPALSELNVSANPGTATRDLIDRSQCTIEKLTLRGQLEYEDVKTILLSCRALKRLVFADHNPPKEAFTQLIPHSVEELSVTSKYAASSSPKFVAFLQARLLRQSASEDSKMSTYKKLRARPLFAGKPVFKKTSSSSS